MLTDDYRMPVVAGTFYPSNPGELIKQIDTFLAKAPRYDIEGNIIGMIVPHAGYIYSGLTASVAFNLLTGRNIKNVIILSPSHREFINGVSLFNGAGYLSPLGKVEIDSEISEELVNLGYPIYKSLDGHRLEHAIEVQIPFLQRVLDNFKIIPLVMAHDDFNICETLSEKLYKVLSKRSDYIIIASSDLSHYKKSDIAHKLDNVIKEDIDKFDIDQLVKDIMTRKTEACGCAPVVCMLKTTKKLGATHSKVLHYSDSGEVFGDKESVVGYLSAVIWKPIE